jgi:hypothetical protein
MVDGQIMERQESHWAVPVQLCRGSTRLLPTYEPIDEPLACEQHTESKEHPSKVKDIPQTLRGLREGAALHHGQDSGNVQGRRSTA